MDPFNNITNEQFIKSFLDQLYSKTDFIQHNDPDDFFDPEQEYGKHITETQEKLYVEIREAMKASNGNFSTEEKVLLFAEKKTELYKVLHPEIETYIEKINVDYR